MEEAKRNSPTANQPAASALTNSDVVETVKVGLGAKIIIAKIKATSSVFDTNVSSLIELKRAGVPESVILAMVQAPANVHTMRRRHSHLVQP